MAASKTAVRAAFHRLLVEAESGRCWSGATLPQYNFPLAAICSRKSGGDSPKWK